MANYGSGNLSGGQHAEGYGGKDEDFTQKALSEIKRARAKRAAWAKEARECYEFYAGRQWSEEDRAQLEEQLRPVITYNRVAPMIDAVIGSEVNNRQEVKFLPRELGDSGVNELYTNAAAWVRDNCDAEDEETDAFLDTLVCGEGWVETRIDYEEELDGKLIQDRIDPLEMLYDPDARKRNVSDTKWRARCKEIDKEEFEAQWPDAVDKLYPDTGAPAFQEDTDGATEDHLADEAWKYENDQGGNEPGYNPKTKTYRVIQYECRKKVPVYRTMNPLTGGIEEVSAEDFKKLKPKLDAEGIPYVKQQKFEYHRAFFCGQILLERGPCPVDGFSFHCITGKRDRNKGHWFGLVRAMLDPQRWANKFFSQILHVINTQAKGGIIAEQSVFPDVRIAESEWARSDSIMIVNDGALTGDRIQPKAAGEYPQGTDRLMEFSLASLREVTGVNIEMLGLANREQPGILEQQRKQAGLTILALVFDSLRRYRKEQGRVLLQFIQKYIADGRLIRIDGTTGPKYVQLIRQKDTVIYDVIVDEAPTSPNQKEQVWQILAPLIPQLVKVGIPIPPDLVDYLPIPESLAQSWKKMVMPAGGDPQQQQQEQQLKARMAEAEVRKVESEVELNEAKTQVELAKVGQVKVDSLKTAVEVIDPPQPAPAPAPGSPKASGKKPKPGGSSRSSSSSGS